MGAYSSRKGSLGFSFKRSKNKIPLGDSKISLWFHKVGMDHNVTKGVTKFEPRTHLELPDTTIKGYLLNNSRHKVYTLEEVREQELDLNSVRTLLEIKSKFQKKPLSRTVPYIESIEQIYNKISTPSTKLKITSITKGKGFSGVISRRGIKLGKRKRARANKERHIGAIGGRTGHVSWRAPHAGNMGNARRTYVCYSTDCSYNESMPLFRYGFMNYKRFAIKGSIPGNIKQLVKVYAVK